MQDLKINQLPIISNLTGNELFPIWINDKSNQSSIDKIKDYIKLNIFSGTSNQFVKGDGSLDSNEYVPMNRGTLWKAASDNSKSTMRFVDNNAAKCAIDKYIECWQDYGESSGWFNFKAGKFIVNGGTSSQFLKADGSVDGTEYLPKSGGTVTGKTTFSGKGFGSQLEVERDGGANSLIAYKNETNGLLGYIGITDEASSAYPGEPVYADKHDQLHKIWHSDNDGAGSGLDADLLDGKQPADLNVGSANSLKGVIQKTTAIVVAEQDGIRFTTQHNKDIEGMFPALNNANGILTINKYTNTTEYSYDSQLGFSSNGNIYYRNQSGGVIVNTTPWKQLAFTNSNVASADKLTTKQLTNEDLNTLKEGGKTVVYLAASNTCTNKPEGVQGFTLQVTLNSVSVAATQILLSHKDSKIYVRYFGGYTWSSWKELATTDGAVTSLAPKLLSNEDLDTLKFSNFTSFKSTNNNTCTNKPNGVGAFGLIVYGIAEGPDCVQILTTNAGNIFKRRWNTLNWSTWKKMLTEDDESLATEQDIKNIFK